MSITIEEKEKIKDFVKFFNEFINQLDIVKGVEMGSPIQTPTFSVGMRVESKGRFIGFFTENMIYRIGKKDERYFYLIDDSGNKEKFNKNEISLYFTPYEKPKKGNKYWIIDEYENDCISKVDWWTGGVMMKTRLGSGT